MLMCVIVKHKYIMEYLTLLTSLIYSMLHTVSLPPPPFSILLPLKGFQMETFAGPVFASLRHSLGMTEKDYQHSLSSEGCYLQFISNSKSKADFFLTCVQGSPSRAFIFTFVSFHHFSFSHANINIFVHPGTTRDSS